MVGTARMKKKRGETENGRGKSAHVVRTFKRAKYRRRRVTKNVIAAKRKLKRTVALGI